MKHNIVEILRRGCCALLFIAAAPLVGAQTPPPAAPKAPDSSAAAAPPPAATDQTSYLFGLTFGEQLHRVGITDQISIEAITRGMKDGLSGKKSTPADQQQVQEYVHSVMEAATTHNQAAAKEFLEHNAKEKGVKVTASGLQYKIVAPGDANAAAIKATDQVTVQYRGKLLDGSEFDSSYTRGQPATFPVTGVIKGWQEALVMMKPGAKWTLFVPPDLAYGSSAKPGIPGGSLLVFDVELVSVKESGAAASPPATDKPAPKTAKPAAKTKPAPKSQQ
jgi:FKBP-type peptidyl-prolyl cis-trans isomerase FklB